MKVAVIGSGCVGLVMPHSGRWTSASEIFRLPKML